jgi:hypothetical protein
MTLAGFEPAIPTNELLQTHALNRASTGIDDLTKVGYEKFPIYEYYGYCYKYFR